MFVFLLLLLPLVTTTTAHDLCAYNCSCSDDRSCQFYCKDGRCQYSIPLFGPCSGYQIHKRECGKFQWCNPSTKVCERGKMNKYFCQYDYECLSNHCDHKGFCQERHEVSAKVVVPSVIAGVLFLAIIIIVIRYQKRIAALKRCSMASANLETKPPAYGSFPYHE